MNAQGRFVSKIRKHPSLLHQSRRMRQPRDAYGERKMKEEEIVNRIIERMKGEKEKNEKKVKDDEEKKKKDAVAAAPTEKQDELGAATGNPTLTLSAVATLNPLLRTAANVTLRLPVAIPAGG